MRKAAGGIVAAALALGLAGCADEGGMPILEPVDDQVVAVGEELVISLRASDPDGDDIDYGFDGPIEGLAERASLTVRPDGTGVFRWTPLGGDVGTWFIDFSASDGNHEDVVTTAIDVRSAVDGSAPTFRQPLGSGTTLDLEHNACLELEVVVDDPDDAEVALAMDEPAIEGADLVQKTGLSGTWAWCPSKAQLEDDRWPLVLSADDGTNPKTIKNYLVVLRHPPRPDCPGEAPTIVHSATDASTVLDLKITAEISDDIGLKNEPILYWTTVEPKLPVDFSQLDVIEMQLQAGDLRSGTWSASIPNPVASAGEGAQSRIWYVISAGDNDDAEGDCDHVTEAPDGGVFEMTVTNPGGNGGAGVCEVCSADVQCGEADDLCATVGNQSGTFCLAGCETNADCDADFACLSVQSVDGVTAKQCVPDSGTCEVRPACEDDDFEDNDTRAQASAAPALTPGDHTGLVSCGDDDDWYRIVVGSEGTVGGLIDGAAAANLNLGLYDAQGNPIALSEGAGSTEVVEECVGAGTYYLRVYSFGSQDADYDLLYEMTPGSCTAMCTDDDFENDDTQATATYAEVWPDPFVAADRMICSDDDDWYEIELYTGETVAVDLTFSQGTFDEDLDLHFHDGQGVDLTPCTESEPSTCSAEQGQSATSNEHYERTIDEQGCAPCTFYVRVHGFAGSQSDYDIEIALQ